MSVDEMDTSRRRFLRRSTTVIAGLGVGAAIYPFLAAWSPSEQVKALGAPVEVDISKIEPGQKITIAWRGQPIFIVHRNQAELASLSQVTDKLRDPDSLESSQPTYAQNQYRSIKKDILVLIGICTHLGCVPLFEPNLNSVEAGWEGGFFCPCHGSKYDMAGRVYKGVPAPLNLAIPPYKYLQDTLILIGEETA